MKTFKSISRIVAALLWMTSVTYSQELAKVVNTPKALGLEARIQQLSQENESLSKIYFGLRDEFNRLLKEAKEKNDRSLYNKFSKEKRPESNSLEIKLDSISKLIAETRTAHSREITNTAESQEVLKKMQEAVKTGESAPKILHEYRNSLKSAALAKLSTKIDQETFKEELKAISKISRAMANLVYLPVTYVNGKKVN